MMKYKLFIVSLFLTLSGIVSLHAQTIERGSQITAEGNMVSGKPYLLYNVGNNGCYVKAVTVSEKEVSYADIRDINKLVSASKPPTAKSLQTPYRLLTESSKVAIIARNDL